MASVRILGPARNLRRVREQIATVEQVLGIFGGSGPAHTLTVTLKLSETRRRIRLLMTRSAWEELEDRLNTACVFLMDRPLKEKEPPAPRAKPRPGPMSWCRSKKLAAPVNLNPKLTPQGNFAKSARGWAATATQFCNSSRPEDGVLRGYSRPKKSTRA